MVNGITSKNIKNTPRGPRSGTPERQGRPTPEGTHRAGRPYEPPSIQTKRSNYRMTDNNKKKTGIGSANHARGGQKEARRMTRLAARERLSRRRQVHPSNCFRMHPQKYQDQQRDQGMEPKRRVRDAHTPTHTPKLQELSHPCTWFGGVVCSPRRI